MIHLLLYVNILKSLCDAQKITQIIFGNHDKAYIHGNMSTDAVISKQIKRKIIKYLHKGN